MTSLDNMVYKLFEAVKKIVKYKVNGKTGVWRTISGNRVFFPDKGKPIGFPRALRLKSKGR